MGVPRADPLDARRLAAVLPDHARRHHPGTRRTPRAGARRTGAAEPGRVALVVTTSHGCGPASSSARRWRPAACRANPSATRSGPANRTSGPGELLDRVVRGGAAVLLAQPLVPGVRQPGRASRAAPRRRRRGTQWSPHRAWQAARSRSIRSGERVVFPLDQRTCSAIGSPTCGGVRHSARSTNGFHSRVPAGVEHDLPHECQRSVDADRGRRVAHRLLTGSW